MRRIAWVARKPTLPHDSSNYVAGKFKALSAQSFVGLVLDGARVHSGLYPLPSALTQAGRCARRGFLCRKGPAISARTCGGWQLHTRLAARQMSRFDPEFFRILLKTRIRARSTARHSLLSLRRLRRCEECGRALAGSRARPRRTIGRALRFRVRPVPALRMTVPECRGSRNCPRIESGSVATAYHHPADR